MTVLPTVLTAISLVLGDASSARDAQQSAARPSVAAWAHRSAKAPFDPMSIRPGKKAQLAVMPAARGRSLALKLLDVIEVENAQHALTDGPARSAFACPENMVMIGHAFCVDVYEATLVEVMPDGSEQPWSPYYAPQPGHKLRAVSVPGVFPQGYISGEQAAEACKNSGKRLCKPDEWKKACMGPKQTFYPYGNENQPKRCNDTGKSPMQHYHHISDDPKDAWKWGANGNMMDPRLNQLEGGLARTGEFAGCTNEYGVFDMVGNLHEWVDDPYGTFQGGYYLDTHLNADGCYYRTTAHAFSHADYSTGFRCCADAAE